MEKAVNIFRAEQSRAEQSRAEQSRAERLLTPFQAFYALFMWKIFRIRRAFFCAEGISQAGMLAFRFGAAREREKLAERVSHRYKVIPLKKSAMETGTHIPYIGNIE